MIKYLEWLKSLVGRCPGADPDDSYDQMFDLMFETPFVSIGGLDDMRIRDTNALRNRYELLTGEKADIPEKAPLRFLEVVVALAVKCEDEFMAGVDYTKRTGLWFWDMLENTGLATLTDRYFDYEAATFAINRVLKRQYLPSGRFGLFRTSNPDIDMRKLPLWEQMMVYLNELLGG